MVLAKAESLKELVETEASFVLIDLRSAKDASKAHIPGAINIPARDLEKSRDRFPDAKGAPIYIYDRDVNVKAFKAISGWGYKRVSVIEGGFGAWKGATASGPIPAPEKIAYEKRLPKNQVSIKEFKSVVETQPADKLILDVRDIASGAFKGSLNVPLDSVAKSMGSIPKDKEILIHCNTGVMAKSAEKILSDAGYRARFLDAVVQISPDGSYEINEKL